jgi:carbamoyltransferase
VNVLGLNGYFNADHDAGAAIAVDGVVTAAVEEERLVRRKHATGLPPHRSAAEVLDLAGVPAPEVDVIAYGWNPTPLGLAPDREASAIRMALRGHGVPVRPDVPVEFVDHHVAHAWSGLAYLPPADRDGVAVLVLDGSGETTSGAGFHFREGAPQRLWHLPLASSLGIFYEGVSAALGFGWGEEGKTMGLAAYGRPSCTDRLPTPGDDRFEGRLPERAEEYGAVLAKVAGAVQHLTGEATFVDRADVAASAQLVLEQRIRSLILEFAPLPPVVVLAGGTALNCAANGRLADELAARGTRLVIPPPASDAGIALGAAAAVAASRHAPRVPAGAYLGRSFPPRALVSQLGEPQPCSSHALATRLWERDAVIGWFDGAAEIGPRALGGRCLIARPDSTRLRDQINVRKGRESWRPLAPSVTVAEFQRSFRGEPSPYMLKASTVLPQARSRLGGVTHVDDSARPQVVAGDGGYRQLLLAMGEVGGVEAVVCTSFNVAGEPMVYTPADALRSARAMALDALAGPGWLIDLKGGTT